MLHKLATIIWRQNNFLPQNDFAILSLKLSLIWLKISSSLGKELSSVFSSVSSFLVLFSRDFSSSIPVEFSPTLAILLKDLPMTTPSCLFSAHEPNRPQTRLDPRASVGKTKMVRSWLMIYVASLCLLSQIKFITDQAGNVKFWSRSDISTCSCSQKSYRHVHCPCSDCNGRATDRSTELRHWRQTNVLFDQAQQKLPIDGTGCIDSETEITFHDSDLSEGEQPTCTDSETEVNFTDSDLSEGEHEPMETSCAI